MNDASSIIREHNQKAAAMWGGPGRAYNEVSRGISSAIDHCVNRLNPQEGDLVLDVATGTGWTSRQVAALGAKVIGVDIADGMLGAAKELAEEANLNIDYRLGDAEALPFADNSFDGVISTFGVMFAPDQEAAIGELARVCKPGGRLAIAAWTPDSTAVTLRDLMIPFMAPPPADAPKPPSPNNWGDPQWMQTTLGDQFELASEDGVTYTRYPTEDDMWQAYARNFGPVKAVYESLDDAKAAELRQVFLSWFADFSTDLGAVWPLQYLVTAGQRK
jgi:SAM-dependent methyltransferase